MYGFLRARQFVAYVECGLWGQEFEFHRNDWAIFSLVGFQTYRTQPQSIIFERTVMRRWINTLSLNDTLFCIILVTT